jgi:hypothetical protein
MAFDLDNIFTYTTIQLVTVRDRRLGIPYYLAMIAITAFIVNNIIADQLYLKSEPPTAGSIRVNLAAPKTLQPITSITYCNGGQGSMANVACGYLAGQVSCVPDCPFHL